jgi:hypothetical protein
MADADQCVSHPRIDLQGNNVSASRMVVSAQETANGCMKIPISLKIQAFKIISGAININP